jgi:hypothetical protein
VNLLFYSTGCKVSGYNLLPQAETNKEIVNCIQDLKAFEGKVFLEVKVKIWVVHYDAKRE